MLSTRSPTLVDLATTVAIVATCGAGMGRAQSDLAGLVLPSLRVPEAPMSTKGAADQGQSRSRQSSWS